MAAFILSALLSISLPPSACGFSPDPAASSPLKRPASLSLSSTAAADAAASSLSGVDAAFWKWRGHDIYTEARAPIEAGEGASRKPAVLLLHGFGAGTTYWRETASVLQREGHAVHALDFLGQGRSSKPFLAEEASRVAEDEKNGKELDATNPLVIGKSTNTNVEYSINLWANLVDDYARHHQLDDVVLMGNSLGSVVALSAATGDFLDSPGASGYLAGDGTEGRSRVAGLCLFNCGVGMNSRNIVKNEEFGPIQVALFNLLFDVINALIFGNKPLLRYALDNVVTKELLEDALKSLYTHSPERVDRELVDSFYYPAKLGGEGAVEAIKQIYTNDAGLTPMELHEKYPEILDSLPIHLIWGREDAVTPLDGDVGLFYRDRVANNRGGKGNTSLTVVSSGHIPFDDNPAETHESMVGWLKRKITK